MFIEIGPYAIQVERIAWIQFGDVPGDDHVAVYLVNDPNPFYFRGWWYRDFMRWWRQTNVYRARRSSHDDRRVRL